MGIQNLPCGLGGVGRLLQMCKKYLPPKIHIFAAAFFLLFFFHDTSNIPSYHNIITVITKSVYKMKFIISSLAINILLSNAQNVNGFSGSHGVQRVGRGGGWFKNTNTAARKIDANKNSNSDTKRTVLSSASTSTAPAEKQVEGNGNDNDVASIWEMIENQLQEASDSDSAEEEQQQKPVLTLYRDTNGWCPFCERVWVCIRAKNLPYQERLISLFDKPVSTLHIVYCIFLLVYSVR